MHIVLAGGICVLSRFWMNPNSTEVMPKTWFESSNSAINRYVSAD
jgi:hypothetical protein